MSMVGLGLTFALLLWVFRTAACFAVLAAGGRYVDRIGGCVINLR